MHLNVEVGSHLSHAELMDNCHAVGASEDRPLNLPGEDLPGSHSATEFVAWYNGHPDYADRAFDLSGERAVVIGNGNVARVLTLPPEWLARTDGLPFELSRGILPTIAGRVIGDGGDPIPGVYATGRIKRGPRGVIGSNRIDATETVDALVEDYRSGTSRIPLPTARR